VHTDIGYKKPAMLGEIIEAAAEVIEISHVTITLRQYVLREDNPIVEAMVKPACINKDGRPRQLPEEF